MNTVINTKILEDIDSLLCNLQNENRPVDKLRNRLRKDMNKEKKYAIKTGGDVAFNDLKLDIYHLGYKPINNQQDISRTNYNTIGIIAGNWMAWSDEFWESIGYEIIDYKTFSENHKKYIPKANY